MTSNTDMMIRPAVRDDVRAIVEMLADDHLGKARERLEDPLPPSYFRAFDTVSSDRNIQLMVAQDNDGTVVGCLQLCILPGLSSQGASRGLIEDVRVASRCRAADAPDPHRCAAILCAARISGQPCRDDIAVLIVWIGASLRMVSRS